MYVKLFSSLYQGTLRGRSDEILVFTNLLAYADQHGVVDKHFKAIADETGLSMARVQAAVQRLEAPDPESRSPEMKGCRIVRLDEHRVWGWRVVNYGKYRAIRSEDDRREQNRMAQERWRERHISKVSRRKPRSAQAEAEAISKEVKDTVGLTPDIRALRQQAVQILNFLNEKTGRNYQPVPANVDFIVNRLKDGATVEDCRQVIAKKAREWKGDEKMDEYLRPATLFNRTKFAQYQGELGKPE